jgi:hypothetical protein
MALCPYDFLILLMHALHVMLKQRVTKEGVLLRLANKLRQVLDTLDEMYAL